MSSINTELSSNIKMILLYDYKIQKVKLHEYTKLI